MFIALVGTVATNGIAKSPTTKDFQGAVKSSTNQEYRLYQPITASSNELKLYLASETLKYGNYNELEKVIQCESSFDNSKIGKAGEIGIAQFKIETWNYFNKIRGTKLNINNPYHQIDMIVWAFNNGYQSHWSCYWKTK